MSASSDRAAAVERTASSRARPEPADPGDHAERFERFERAMSRADVPAPPPPPAQSIATPPPAARVAPRWSVPLVAGALVAIVLMGIVYALSMKSTVEHAASAPPAREVERTVPAPAPPAITAPTQAPSAALPASPAATNGTGSAGAAGKAACPPGVAAMDLCGSYDAQARKD